MSGRPYSFAVVCISVYSPPPGLLGLNTEKCPNFRFFLTPEKIAGVFPKTAQKFINANIVSVFANIVSYWTIQSISFVKAKSI